MYLGTRQAAKPLLKYGFRPSDVPQYEADALIWLYHHANGDGWTNNTNWLSDRVVGNWHGVTVAGGHATGVDLNTNNLVGDIGRFPIARLKLLDNLRLYGNAGVSGDISGWVLPAPLWYLYLYSTGVSGDISGWVLPATLQYLYLNDTGVSGDISVWVLPATLTTLLLNDTGVSGDISGWVLPASLRYLYLYSTGVSGDISVWVLPATLTTLLLNDTGVSGDISGWVLPATLQYLRLNNTGVSGDPTMTSAVALRDFQIQDCGLIQADVDANMLNLYNRRMSFTNAAPTCDIGGVASPNAAPSGIYQAACPPGAGKEYIFELENDSCGDGFNLWNIAFNP